MLFSKYLDPFLLYNIILLFFFSSSVTSYESSNIIFYLSFVVFHFGIIYLGLYYYRNVLYIIYFIYGLSADLLLLNNQIGPHLLTFMVLLFILNRAIQLFKNLNSMKMYLLIIFTQIIVIFLEMALSKLLFNYELNFINYFNLILISLISSYPILLLFNKIDNIK